MKLICQALLFTSFLQFNLYGVEKSVIWPNIKITPGQTGNNISILFRNELTKLEQIHELSEKDLNYLFSYSPDSLDYILSGEYKRINFETATLIIKATNLSSGDVLYFQATSSPESVSKITAKQFFDYFQLNKLSKWNIKTNLVWSSPNGQDQNKVVDNFSIAKDLCKNSGARLPYAEELIAAHSIGGYKTGGIELDYSRENFYAVKNRASLHGNSKFQNFFYYTGNESQIFKKGRLLSGAGFTDEITPVVKCVKGPIQEKLKYVEKLFFLHQTQNGNLSHPAKMAIRYLISKSTAARIVKDYPIGNFDSIKIAKKYLKGEYNIDL